jgi:hypothetical protein
MNADTAVTASFNNSALTPGAPQNLAATPGNNQAIFTFLPPSNTGGSAIQQYTVTCNPGALTATGANSPITFTGLQNGTTYSCSATATNASTTGPASNTVSVTPAPAPLALVGTFSRKVHAGVTYDLPIDTTKPVTGALTVEPRRDKAHNVVFRFNDVVNSAGTVTATDVSGAALGSATPTVSGNEVTVTLSGVDDRRVRVALNGVNSALNVAASIGFLIGDEDANGSITASDLLRFKGRIGQATSSTNFLYDVTLDGAVTGDDQLAVKPKDGSTLR